MNGLHEILTSKYFMIDPQWLQTMRGAIENNLNGHILLQSEDDKIVNGKVLFTDNGLKNYSDKDAIELNINLDTEKFINICYATGPITRNGGTCSYGSKDHRDEIMRSANKKGCIGHIFYINTPGGTAWAKNDYKQAIEYAHSKGQPVLAFVDGMCASAGMYLAALCDERYYMNPKNEIGCIGTMACFYTNKDGSKNKYTNETYHEIYDPESFNKNQEIREIANNEDSTLLLQELALHGAEFRADVLKACPKATKEHLHGKIFNAEDVKGILMDDQKTFEEVLNRVVELSAIQNNKAAISVRQNFPNQINKTMNKKYTQVASLLGVDSLVVTSEGTHLDVSLLDTAEANLTTQQELIAECNDLKEKIASFESEQNESKAAYEATIAEKEATITDLQEKLDKATKDVAANQNVIDEGKTTIETLNAKIAELEQELSDSKVRITELTNSAGETPKAGASPTQNGGGVDMPHLVGMPAYDSTKSPIENKRILEEYKKERANMVK